LDSFWVFVGIQSKKKPSRHYPAVYGRAERFDFKLKKMREEKLPLVKKEWE